MTIRPATQDDVPAILTIVEKCALGLEGVDYSKWDGLTLVAQRGMEVVGFVNVLPAKPLAVITEIGVLPEHQGGRALVELMKGLELLLRSLGCKAWVGYVGEKRTRAREVLSHWENTVECNVGSMYLRRFV